MAQRTFLQDKRFAVLATVNPDGSPHLTVMWYLLDGDDIVFNTAAGRRKAVNLERDQRVSLTVYDDASPYRYLRMEGRVRIVHDPDVSQADIRRLALRYYDGDEAKTERAMRENFSTQQRISYRLRARRVYAPGLSA